MPSEKNGATKEGWQGMACTVCHAHHPKYFLLRWILGILILFLVLWVGIKIGEFKAYFDSNFGDGYFNHRGMMYNNDGYYPWGMMYPPNSSTNSTTTPSTSTKK